MQRANIKKTYLNFSSLDNRPKTDQIVTHHTGNPTDDNLSAIVAQLVSADLLIILSDIDGFYNSDPRKNPDSKLIKTVEKITPELEACAGGAGSSLGTGGMATKLTAAKRAYLPARHLSTDSIY